MSKLTERLRKGAQSLLESAGDLQERIRERAQAIWEREGRPEGRHEDHWRKAEKEIAGEDSDAAPARPKTTVNKPRKGSAGLKPARTAAAGAKKSSPLADTATSKEVSDSIGARQARSSTKSPRAATPKTRRAVPKDQA